LVKPVLAVKTTLLCRCRAATTRQR
jgi:hypothetical protein